MRPERVGRGATIMVALAALLMTSGCVRFGGKTPEKLIGLSSNAAIPAGQMVTAPSASAIMVMLPSVPRAFATSRVAVRDSTGAFTYVTDATWVDSPGRMFQALLSETIAARTGRLVLDPGQFVSEPDGRLTGALIEFAIDSARHEAVVTYDANLAATDGSTISKRRFSATAPIGKIDSNSVAPALNEAANTIAMQVADWIKAPQ